MATSGERYDARFARLAAEGHHLHGEADLVDALLGGPPGRVLDAGCGTGRVAIELARRGYQTHGIDVDPGMLSSAQAKAPDLSWQLADLAALPPGALAPFAFDLALAAGNVLRFVRPVDRPRVVAAMADAVTPGGLVVCGYSLGPLEATGRPGPEPLTLAEHDGWARRAGQVLVARWATWDGDPYDGGDYAVSVHWRPSPSGSGPRRRQ